MNVSAPGDRLPARHLSADYRSAAHLKLKSPLNVVSRLASLFAGGDQRRAPFSLAFARGQPLCAFTFQVAGQDPCQCNMGTVRQGLQDACKVLQGPTLYWSSER